MNTFMTRADALALIDQRANQGDVLGIPRVFIQLTGDANTALFLNQALYWSERTDDPDGWFYKTGDEWERELGLSYYKLSRASKLCLTLGLEKKVKKVNGTPKTHYRIDRERFTDAFLKFLESQVSRKSDFEETQKSEVQETRKSSYTETTSKTTPETPDLAAGSEAAAKPARPVPPHIAVIEAWHKNIPEAIRPPGKPSFARNVRVARDIAEAGLTAEQVGRFVRETYSTYATWAIARGQPRVMSLEHVKTYLKDFLDKETHHGQKQTTTPPDGTRIPGVLANSTESRSRVPEGAIGKPKL